MSDLFKDNPFQLRPNPFSPETAPETGKEPARPLTDEEATYVAGTLGSAVASLTIELVQE